jgi:glutamate dehydrogenase
LRWSDRQEDFRTEILGLVKAQMVKNTVIVPSGAKGGFVVKRGPSPADREAWLAEGVSCYQAFIGALLDVTDNLVDGNVVPPIDVVRHDTDDPYLVVAADKGTATFSDIANKISLDRGFWMGDAFASGGSVGYDHKGMGITARGAWESVKRHFLELGVDTQTQDFTVVGVGDMSGDVFGNGMLLSQHIRLVAAFDHRHIFLDPHPDATNSWVERKRLFELPRSSWEDYNANVISFGGGVFPRSAKSIDLSHEVKEVLGIDQSISAMSPNDLLAAILKAPVDLLWNGGIGTYIKSSTETHAQVGDKANDGLRVNGADLRCKVVGEGGNLGCTQLGRIEAARNGVKINTDAIDNSAGVDTSDHEVNIKILLNLAMETKNLGLEQRNTLLSSMTDEVALLVLRDNYEQNVILEQSRFKSAEMLRVHQRLMHTLESTGLLNRAVEYLPSDSQIDTLHSQKLGLSSPELSVLMAYVKIDLTSTFTEDPVVDEDWCINSLNNYFPSALRERYSDLMLKHPLRREIIATVLTNDMVNRGGISFALRANEESGATPADVLRAYVVSKEIFGFVKLWQEIESLDGKVSTDCQVALYLESRRLLDRATRWFLQSRGGKLDVAAEISKFAAEVTRLSTRLPELLRGVEKVRYEREVQKYIAMGAPQDLARQIAGLLDAFSLLDVVEIAARHKADSNRVVELYFALSERYDVDRLLHHITNLPRDDRWTAYARSALRSDLYVALAGLTSRVTQATQQTDSVDNRIETWESKFAEGVGRTRLTLNEIAASDNTDLATLSVALRSIRTLVGQGAN